MQDHELEIPEAVAKVLDEAMIKFSAVGLPEDFYAGFVVAIVCVHFPKLYTLPVAEMLSIIGDAQTKRLKRSPFIKNAEEAKRKMSAVLDFPDIIGDE